MRTLFKLLIWLAVLAAGLAGGAWWWLQQPLQLSAPKLEVAVPNGASLRTAANRAVQSGVKLPADVLYAYFRLKGNEQTIKPGEVQRMTAGSGVVHAEENHAAGKETHFLQIWLLPSKPGIEPGYAQKMFADEQKRGKLLLVASPDGAEGSVQINANARLFAGLFDGAESAQLALPAARKTYVHLVRGSLNVNGQPLTAGDAALIDNESSLTLDHGDKAEVLVFDLEP